MSLIIPTCPHEYSTDKLQFIQNAWETLCVSPMTPSYRRNNFTITLSIIPSILQISEIIFKTSLHQEHCKWIRIVIDLDKNSNSGQKEENMNTTKMKEKKKEHPNLVFNKHDCFFHVQGLCSGGRLQSWAAHTWTRICNLMRRKEGVNPLSLSESVKVLQRNSTYRPDDVCVCVSTHVSTEREI